MNINKADKIAQIAKQLCADEFKKTTKVNMQHSIQKNEQKLLQALEAQANIAKADVLSETTGLEKLQQDLKLRLEKLNMTTGTEHSPQRFGKDGIEDILHYAQSKENIALINQQLDKLEQGKSIWTGTICGLFDSQKSHSFTKRAIDSKADNLLQKENSHFDAIPQSAKFFVTPGGAKIAGPFKKLLCEKSTIPEVIELEAKMKKMGYSCNFADNLETGKIITNAYENLTQRGIKMPKEVALMIPEKEGIMGFRPYSTRETRFDTPFVFSVDLSKPTKNNRIFNGIKHNATDSPESIVYHEVGHFLHEQTKKDFDIANEIWKKLTNNGYDIGLAKEVGFYAMTGDKFNTGNEFVAEVFAGLMEGKQYSKRVMNIYNALGGPKL